ncbi:MAG: hypothetical protein NTX22_00540 [Ignavibacteriales bacterium]|nr:hypothetical protein [Ignavibacteriales bacterium]
MFEREIKFIYDFNINQVKKLGASFTFNALSSTDLHPAIRNYISAEVDYLIYEDRKKIIENSNFDYSGEEINKYFLLINNEIRKEKRLSSEYVDQLILHATSFTVNFLAQPKWALTKLVFAKENTLNIQEVKQILNYVHYYDHLKELLEKFFTKKRIITIDKSEFEILVDRIYNQLFSAYSEKIINNVLSNAADFFNVGSTHKTTVPLFALELFLKERKLENYLERLENALPTETKLSFSINELQNILFSPVPIKKGTYLERAIKQEEPATLFSFEEKHEEIELKEIIPEPVQQPINQVIVTEPIAINEKEELENIPLEITEEAITDELHIDKKESEENSDHAIDKDVVEQKTIGDDGDWEENVETAEHENQLDKVIDEPITLIPETNVVLDAQPGLFEQIASLEVDEEKENIFEDNIIKENQFVPLELPQEFLGIEEILEMPTEISTPIQEIVLEEPKNNLIPLTEEPETEIQTREINDENSLSILAEKVIQPDELESVKINSYSSETSLPLEEKDELEFTAIVKKPVIEEPNIEESTTQKLIEKEIEELDLDLVLSDEDFLILGEEKLKTNDSSNEHEKKVESEESLNHSQENEAGNLNIEEESEFASLKNESEIKFDEDLELTKDEIIRDIEEEDREFLPVESKVLDEIDEEIKILSNYSEPDNIEVSNDLNLTEQERTEPIEEIIEPMDQDLVIQEQDSISEEKKEQPQNLVINSPYAKRKKGIKFLVTKIRGMR